MVAVVFVRFNLSERPNALVGIALASDVVFSPFLPINYPSQVGLLTTVANVAIAFVLLRLCVPLVRQYLARLLSTLEAGIIELKPRAKSLTVLLALALIGPVSAHDYHFEEGSGFDAPMRIHAEVDGVEVWVEFMLWPPKAPQSCQILLVAEDNESRIDSMWAEIVFPDEDGEVRMIQSYKQYPDQ